LDFYIDPILYIYSSLLAFLLCNALFPIPKKSRQSGQLDSGRGGGGENDLNIGNFTGAIKSKLLSAADYKLGRKKVHKERRKEEEGAFRNRGATCKLNYF
jgi:hypothetical protein